MEIHTKKIHNKKGEVEAVQVPLAQWERIVQALNIREERELSDEVKAKMHKEYDFINETFQLRADQFIELHKLSIHPEYLGGTACFYEAPRLPVKTLVDYLRGGSSIDDYLDDYDTVSRATVEFFAMNMKQK